MKVKQTKINPGSILGEYIVVTKGVKPGDNIVLDGLQKVHNGSMVQVGSSTAQQEGVRK
jgi:multidrug efflux pump subunit AcrA (membrane-fusion protein)